MAAKKKTAKSTASKKGARKTTKGLAGLSHKQKFKKIAQTCQAEVDVGGKKRAKAVGACMKREFKALKDD